MTDDQIEKVARAIYEALIDKEISEIGSYDDCSIAAQAAIEAIQGWAKDNAQTFDWRNGAANSKECIIFPTPPQKG